MSYPNSLMELRLCLVVFLYRNIAHFGNFWSNICLIHSNCYFYDHVFAWNHGTQICFLCEAQKYGEKLNNTWMITFHIGILTIFGNFWANICLIHSTRFLSGSIFAWNHCGQNILLYDDSKNCASLKIWWKFLPKTNKNSQIWGKIGKSRKILDKLSA